MSLHKLFLFTKDTNASATEQGFQYQKLKTLKTWIKNRIEKIDEVIYCDYEDDIFQRNLKEGKVKFRQIKLYSSNFSFSKEEIHKSLAHFFMLFVKGEYKFDDVNFLFETNSGVARKVKGNDADLLQEWATNQEALSHELRDKCRIRVKGIIDEYITEAYNAKISSEEKTKLQQAKNIYNQLSVEIWNLFISSIRWQFDVIPQEQAIPLLLDDITLLITNLPLPIDPAKVSTYISVLHFEIAIKTAQDSEEDKILTNQLLDILLLNEGSEKEKWYGKIFEKWSLVKEVKQFNIGAFYEAISAARHCRWEMHDSDHEGLWLGLLKKYIDLDETIILCRRKAIYEYLFLMLCPDPKTGQPKGKISEQHDLIRYYFKELEHRNSVADIEEDIILLQITQTQQLFHGDFIDAAEITEWAAAIMSQIDEKISNPVNADELCQAYELKGHFIFHINPRKPLIEKIDAAIDAYKKILEPLKNAKTYSVFRLNDQLTKSLNMFISQGVKDQVIEAIENFIIEIEELAAKTGRQHNFAHTLVKRGVAYLSNPSSKNYLKALDCFHKAKDLWYLRETKEGYILSLINIAQVYSSLGMHMAAKYYGLCGVWASIHFGDYTTLKRISDSYAIVFHADFEQGAWMSALDNFEKFIHARHEFASETLNLEDDSLLQNSVFDLSCILAATPLLHPDLSVFIEYQKTNLGWLYTDHLKDMIDAFNVELGDKEGFKQMVSNKLSDVPLNDVGTTREIKFSLLGIQWEIVFKNNVTLNAIAEEFCALLQITLCEVGLLNADFHLLELPITITISLANDYTNFIHQQPSHENTAWDISIPVLDAKEPAKIQLHYGFLATNIKLLLNNLSLLPKDEFEKVFNDLYAKQKLGEKGLVINTYQKVYFNLLNEEDFNKSMRAAFQPIPEKDYNLTSSDMLMPVERESVKYNHDQCIENINHRYINTVKRLNISLTEWQKLPEFRTLIYEFRQQGWLDWQILCALMNYVLNVKANDHMNFVTTTNEGERRTAFQVEFNRLFNLSEDECYMEIPFNWLRTAEFQFNLYKMPVDTLESFGLQNNMAHPNFIAVRSFLNKRFHFDKDDVSDSSPFRTI